MCFISGLSNWFKRCPYFFWGCFSLCRPHADINNLKKIMRKSQNVLSTVPSAGTAEKSKADFFLFFIFFSIKIKKKKKMHPPLCCSLSHTPTNTRPDTHSNPLTSIQTNKWRRADERARQRREEGEEGWCLVFIIHTLVACSVTLFSLSSLLSLTLSGLIEPQGDCIARSPRNAIA